MSRRALTILLWCIFVSPSASTLLQMERKKTWYSTNTRHLCLTLSLTEVPSICWALIRPPTTNSFQLCQHNYENYS